MVTRALLPIISRSVYPTGFTYLMPLPRVVILLKDQTYVNSDKDSFTFNLDRLSKYFELLQFCDCSLAGGNESRFRVAYQVIINL